MTATTTSRSPTATRVIATAVSVIFFDTFLYGVLIPLVPVYSQELHIAKATIGAIFSVYGLPLILLSAPFGALGDRIGRGWVLRGAMLLLAAATGCFALATLAGNVPLLVAARLVQGTAAAGTWATAMAMMAELGRDGTIARKMVWVNLAASGGTIAGPFFGGLLAGVLGIAGVFGLFGAAAALLSFAVATLPTAPPDGTQTRGNPFTDGIALLRRSGGLAVALGLTLLNGMLLGLNEILAPFHLRGVYNSSERDIGLAFGALFIGSNLAQPLVARWSDRIGRLRPMLVGAIATILAAVTLVLPVPFPLFCALFALVGMMLSVLFTPLLPLITEAARGEQTGMLIGTSNTIWSIGYLIGPILGGVAAGALGRFDFLVIAGVACIALGIVLWLSRVMSSE